MRLTLRALTVMVFLLAAAMTASAGTVTLTIDNGGSNVSGGVYVGPYNFTTSGGQSLQLICDTFQNDVFPPETWTANMYTLGSGTGLFGSTSSAQYEQVAWLAQQMFANLSNTTLVAEIQWAIWDIFDSGSCTTGVSNCDPYGTPANQSAINALVAEAENPTNYENGNYSNVVVYTPVSGWPSGDGTPQEYIGIVSSSGSGSPQPNSGDPPTVPEPGSLMLIGTGLVGLVTLRSRFSN